MARKRLLEHQHRKKRKPLAWDDETPLIRLVNPQQIDRFRVSTIELCRYLSAHSNLGSPASIHRALYRAINGEKPK